MTFYKLLLAPVPFWQPCSCCIFYKHWERSTQLPKRISVRSHLLEWWLDSKSHWKRNKNLFFHKSLYYGILTAILKRKNCRHSDILLKCRTAPCCCWVSCLYATFRKVFIIGRRGRVLWFPFRRLLVCWMFHCSSSDVCVAEGPINRALEETGWTNDGTWLLKELSKPAWYRHMCKLGNLAKHS